jgi:hypothetical protein
VREAIRTRGEEVERVIMKELSQMITKGVWTPVDGRKLTAEERSRIIRSSMFLNARLAVYRPSVSHNYAASCV